MLIVLEGCDGTGKSTLARFLADTLDAEVIHCTSRTPNTYGFFSNIIRASKTRNIIADRFCYGQFVYQLPSDRNLDEMGLNMLEAEMLDAGVKVIHVVAPVADIAERLSLRGENADKPSEDSYKSVQEVIDGFDTLFDRVSMLPVMRYDTSIGEERGPVYE